MFIVMKVSKPRGGLSRLEAFNARAGAAKRFLELIREDEPDVNADAVLARAGEVKNFTSWSTGLSAIYLFVPPLPVDASAAGVKNASFYSIMRSEPSAIPIGVQGSKTTHNQRVVVSPEDASAILQSYPEVASRISVGDRFSATDEPVTHRLEQKTEDDKTLYRLVAVV